MADITLYEFTITGDKLLMHNGQMANPFNSYAKALKVFTSKKGKTEDDAEEIAKIEFQGGLYFNDDPKLGKVGPIIPGLMVEGMLMEAALKFKRGLKGTFEASVRATEDFYPLIYDGPRTREELWEQAEKFAHICMVVNPGNGARVQRCRPQFRNWTLKGGIKVLGNEVSGDDLLKVLTRGGEMAGLGDGRPRFAGLFTVEEFAEVGQKVKKKAS